MNKSKIMDFLWETFSDKYLPWRELNTKGLDPNKGITVCIPCGYSHRHLVYKAISSVSSLDFVKEVLVNIQENISWDSTHSETVNEKVRIFRTHPMSPSESRDLLRSKVEKTDYIFYLDADDSVDRVGLKHMYDCLQLNPNCLIAPNNAVVDTDADVLFGLQSSVIAPKTLKWVKELEVLEDCATYCGYAIKVVDSNKKELIVKRAYLPNGQRNKDSNTNIFKYLIWLIPILPFNFLNYIYLSNSKNKHYFLKWFVRFLGRKN